MVRLDGAAGAVSMRGPDDGDTVETVREEARAWPDWLRRRGPVPRRGATAAARRAASDWRPPFL